MILHHYEMSPFSEKIRLMFGHAGLPWQSLLSPEMPPRPNVDPLTGGYRRIPIAQVGADLYCDTRLISEELAQRTGNAALSPYHGDADKQAYIANLEGAIFWACVLSIPVGTTLKQLIKTVGIWKTLRFLKDRAGVGKAARMQAPSPKEAAATFQAHLEDLEQRLQADFLFGDAPGNADFSAYHTLWFKRVVGGLPMPPKLPAVDEWYQRMTAMGHGERREINQDEAFTVARENSPRPIAPEQTVDASIGNPVSIGPSDYALDAVAGILVGSSPTRYILAREKEQFGTVHVHFPRAGFELTTRTAS